MFNTNNDDGQSSTHLKVVQSANPKLKSLRHTPSMVLSTSVLFHCISPQLAQRPGRRQTGCPRPEMTLAS